MVIIVFLSMVLAGPWSAFPRAMHTPHRTRGKDICPEPASDRLLRNERAVHALCAHRTAQSSDGISLTHRACHCLLAATCTWVMAATMAADGLPMTRLMAAHCAEEATYACHTLHAHSTGGMRLGNNEELGLL